MVLNFNKKVTDDYLSNSVNEMKGGNSYHKKIKEKPVYIHAIQDVVNRKQEKAGYEDQKPFLLMPQLLPSSDFLVLYSPH